MIAVPLEDTELSSDLTIYVRNFHIHTLVVEGQRSFLYERMGSHIQVLCCVIIPFLSFKVDVMEYKFYRKTAVFEHKQFSL